MKFYLIIMLIVAILVLISTVAIEKGSSDLLVGNEEKSSTVGLISPETAIDNAVNPPDEDIIKDKNKSIAKSAVKKHIEKQISTQKDAIAAIDKIITN
jgi:hypothetical protein